MRIGLDAREAFREQPRGVGHHTRNLIQQLGALAPGDEFVLYHDRPAPPDLPALAPNVRPRRVDPRGGRWHSFERLAMPWRMRRDAVDVYHGTYNTLPPRVPLWRGPPMVVTVHDLIVTWWPDDENDLYVRYARAVTPRVLRDAAHVLTVSEWSKADIVERHGVDPARISVTYNGVHPSFHRERPAGAVEAARTRWADGRPYLFAIGSRLRRKNTARMLEALGVLHARRPLEHLVLVSGLAHTRDDFQAAADRAGIGDRVRFLPYLSQDDLVAVYAGADLSVYPSMVEGWGIPVIESLVVGTPVSTSATTGMREAGGDDATFFDPADVDSIADGIERALDGLAAWPARRDAAIARAKSYSWQRAAEITLDVYRRVARR